MPKADKPGSKAKHLDGLAEMIESSKYCLGGATVVLKSSVKGDGKRV